MANYKTPGVYINEENAFPASVAAVETAIPVFIGYTQKAIRSGNSLTAVPTRISSLAQYVELFGGAFKPTFTITEDTAGNLQLNNKVYTLDWSANNRLYFYSCIRLFYLNGGGDCFILSIGSYEDAVKGIDPKRYTGDPRANPPIPNVFDILEKEYEPTLVLMPDVVAMINEKDPEEMPAYYTLYQEVLKHCHKTQSRMGLFDVARSADGKHDTNIAGFREGIGTNFLCYGAAYYPWLQTTVIDEAEVDFRNLSDYSILATLIPGSDTVARGIIETMQGDTGNILSAAKNYHQALMASSQTYTLLMKAIRSRMNLLPPAAAMAGIFTTVDNARGVWKAPANIAVAATIAPEVTVSQQEQETFNVDAVTGKSINVIRMFPGTGPLVWGARTLDGNSQDWRYINVRRTGIMIEQSLKLATRAYVFEPNTAATWVTIKSMFNNFLTNVWKQGALAGATPNQAFSVQVGLGATMTPNDILDGILRVTVLLALVRPAEFIEITFQQQMQQS